MQRLQVHVLGNSKIAGSLAVRGSDMTKLKLMFCDICVNSQIVNSFTTGCDIMKKECVTKHEYRKGKLLQSLVYVYPLLRRSTIIVLDKNDKFLLLGYIYIGNSRYFQKYQLSFDNI
jgi:hypothetical protein